MVIRKPHCHGNSHPHRALIRMAGLWGHSIALISHNFHTTLIFSFPGHNLLATSGVGFWVRSCSQEHVVPWWRLTHWTQRWLLYWCLRQGGKNILLPIFLSEVNGQLLSLPSSRSLHRALTSPTSLFALTPRLFPRAREPGCHRVLFMHGGCRLWPYVAPWKVSHLR